MGIQKRGGYWYATWYEKIDGKLKQQKRSCGKRKGDAEAYLGKILSARKENRLFDIKKEYNHTFDELLERYKEAFKNQKSFKDKAYHFPLFEERFSGRLLGNITPYDLEVYRNERKNTPVKCGTDKVIKGYLIREKHPVPPRERKVSTVNRELSTLRHLFSKAVEWGMMESSPFKRVKKLFFKENNQRVRFLTEVEEIRLLKNCAEYLISIIIVAINTGMRKGEILTLTWAQMRNGFIYLRKTKTEEARQIPLNNTLKQLFTTMPRHFKSDYVFVNPSTGIPYTDISKSFTKALEKAGIEDFTFHDLRHTFASRLVMAGKGLKVVQTLLGHTDLKMTMRYAHLADDFLVDAVKVLDKVEEKSKYKVRTGEGAGAQKSTHNEVQVLEI